MAADRERTPSVLHVIDSLGISGGAEKQLALNLDAFDHSLIHHEVAVVKPTESTRLEELSVSVEVHELFGAGERVTRPAAVARLYQLVRRRRPGLVHASLPTSALATRLVAAASRILAVESLVNISHEPIRTIDNPNVTMAKLRAHAALDWSTMRFLSGYHAVSREVADSWARTVGLDPARIEVIPRGIEIGAVELTAAEREEAARSVRSEFGFGADSLILLAIGRVEPQKGHRYLLEALARLESTHPEVRALIVGRSGHASPHIEELIDRYRLSDAVRLTGTRRDMPRLLAASDIFVFPSLFEGNGGNAMIEAMAAGIPVITTAAAPMTDLVPNDEFGLLVERRDSGGLAAAIGRLIADPGLRETLARSAKARAATFATPAEVAKSHEQWYLRLFSS